MSQLFNLAKIAVFLDGFTPSIEKRRGEETKIVTCAFRVQPFDVKHARAIDDGLGGDSNVRQSLFNLNDDDKKPHLERVALSLGCPRQTLVVFAAPDAPVARIALTQVKISGTYARTQKDVQGYAFCFKGSFGPLGKDDFEFLNHWFLSQQFVSFEEAEPGLDLDDEGDDDALIAAGPSRPTPMWDDGDEPALTFPGNGPAAVSLDDAETRETAARPIAKRGTKKKAGKHDPDVERARQASAAKAKGGKGKPNGAAHA